MWAYVTVGHFFFDISKGRKIADFMERRLLTKSTEEILQSRYYVMS